MIYYRELKKKTENQIGRIDFVFIHVIVPWALTPIDPYKWLLSGRLFAGIKVVKILFTFSRSRLEFGAAAIYKYFCAMKATHWS